MVCLRILLVVLSFSGFGSFLFWFYVHVHVGIRTLNEDQHLHRRLALPTDIFSHDSPIFVLVNHACFEMLQIAQFNIQKQKYSLFLQQKWKAKNCENELTAISNDACPLVQTLRLQNIEQSNSFQTLSEQTLNILQLLCGFPEDFSEKETNRSASIEDSAFCFKSMKTFGIQPRKSWGSASKVQQGIWIQKDCDSCIQSSIQKCTQIFTEKEMFGLVDLPLKIRMQWKERNCDTFFIDRVGETHNVDCFEVMKKFGIQPGKTWGSASKQIQETWIKKNCDTFVRSNSQNHCSKLFNTSRTSNRIQMSIETRKEWDQHNCNKLFPQQMPITEYLAPNNFQMTKKQENLVRFSNPSLHTITAGNGQVATKPALFPRESTLYEVLPSASEPGFRKEVNVVLWNDFSGFLLWGTDSYRTAAQEKCSTICKIHLQSEMGLLMNRIDAFMIHAKNHRGDFPKINDVSTKLILVSLEQPGYATRMVDRSYLTRFDFYTTYQLDSFVPLTYMEPEWKVEDFYVPQLPLSQKQGLVAIFISNSKAAGAAGRTRYVQELMNYVQVDSFGGCLNNYNEEKKLHELGVQPDNIDRKQRKHEILKHYKFYLAFENAQVLDYTSEKVFEGLRAGALPVYRGSSSVNMLLPHTNSIINANYMSPLELANYLREVASNDQMYQSYFEWKNIPASHNFTKVMEHSAHSFTSMCHICQKLAENR